MIVVRVGPLALLQPPNRMPASASAKARAQARAESRRKKREEAELKSLVAAGHARANKADAEARAKADAAASAEAERIQQSKKWWALHSSRKARAKLLNAGKQTREDEFAEAERRKEEEAREKADAAALQLERELLVEATNQALVYFTQKGKQRYNCRRKSSIVSPIHVRLTS